MRYFDCIILWDDKFLLDKVNVFAFPVFIIAEWFICSDNAGRVGIDLFGHLIRHIVLEKCTVFSAEPVYRALGFNFEVPVGAH